MNTAHGGDLPLPDYDQLSLGELEHRICSLNPGELEQLARHERTHAARVPVMELLSSRRSQLDAGSTPSSGSPGGAPPRPGEAEAARRGSPVSPATASPPVHPPPHGSPDQPAQPKGNRRT